MLLKTKQEITALTSCLKQSNRPRHICSNPLQNYTKASHIIDYNHSTPPLATIPSPSFSPPRSQTATELEVSADSDQKELLLLLAVEWSLVLVFTLQPRDLSMSRS